MVVENKYEKQQRPFRIRKSLKELVHMPRIQKTQQSSIILPPLPTQDSENMEYVYDVLYECQRGSLAVGYSSKTLLQFDPNPWCDAKMRFTPMNIDTYQLPDPTWEWVSDDWMIDMTGDVDEAGWQYALKFHGAEWHGNYKHFRSFVRRRRWIRLRRRSLNSISHLEEEEHVNTIKTRTLIDIEEPTSSSTLLKDQEIIEKLQTCRLDRERLNILDDLIIPEEKALTYLTLFDYEESKYKFLAKLLLQKRLDKFKLVEAIQSLSFYCDVQSILNEIEQ